MRECISWVKKQHLNFVLDYQVYSIHLPITNFVSALLQVDSYTICQLIESEQEKALTSLGCGERALQQAETAGDSANHGKVMRSVTE